MMPEAIATVAGDALGAEIALHDDVDGRLAGSVIGVGGARPGSVSCGMTGCTSTMAQWGRWNQAKKSKAPHFGHEPPSLS